MKPLLVITHASFDAKRRQACNRLLGRLRSEVTEFPFVVVEDSERKGSLWCWRQALDIFLLDPELTHVVWLPDDALICDDFGKLILACIAARPNDVFQTYVNDPRPTGHALWSSSYDGWTGVGSVMPRELVLEHLRWREEHLEAPISNDGGVCLWAMDTGRLLYTTAWSLTQHDEMMPSLDGHDSSPVERSGLHPIGDIRSGVREDVMNLLGRTYACPELGVKTSCIHMGRVYKHNHLALLTHLKPPRVERYWDIERQRGRIEEHRKVMIAMPGHHRDIDQGVMASVIAEIQHLRENGWDGMLNITTQDSHVNRVRNRLVSHFLASDCTHLLWWDRDNFPIGRGAVLKLLETGHDVVGGAVPLKDGSGKLFACQLGLDPGDYAIATDGFCLPAVHVGTGFLLVSRKAIVKLATLTHEQTFYVSGMPDSLNRAEWFLFADAVRDRKHLSEDWEFCRKWTDAGGKVYLRPDIDFVHVGEHQYVGSFDRAFARPDAS